MKQRIPPLLERVRPYWHLLEKAGEAFDVDPFFLAAIMDRETLCGFSPALDKPGPGGRGDGGHGHGLFQIDDRFHAAFMAKRMPDGTPAWADAWEAARYAAHFLASLLRIFEGSEACAAAAYNAGPDRVKACVKELTRPWMQHALCLAVDPLTTGRDYASDVLRRKESLLKAWAAAQGKPVA
jgi:hypothetical protein